jgi:hypothetical protein
MPAAMKPRLLSRAASNGTPLVGSTGIERSSSPVERPPAPYTVLGRRPERKYRRARAQAGW